MEYAKGMLFRHSETEEIVTIDREFFLGAITVLKENGERTELYPYVLNQEFVQIQRVWFCLSGGDHNGYFLWEVREETGNPENNYAPNDLFTECRDGSRVLIQCFHFFTKEKAQEHIDYYNENEWLNHHIMIGE